MKMTDDDFIHWVAEANTDDAPVCEGPYILVYNVDTDCCEWVGCAELTLEYFDTQAQANVRYEQLDDERGIFNLGLYALSDLYNASIQSIKKPRMNKMKPEIKQALLEILIDRFPWITTTNVEANGGDAIDTLNDIYQELGGVKTESDDE